MLGVIEIAEAVEGKLVSDHLFSSCNCGGRRVLVTSDDPGVIIVEEQVGFASVHN